MHKRVFAWFLTFAMLVGMLPAGILVSAEGIQQTNVLNAAFGTAALDGALDDAWSLTGALGETRFGAMYDGDNLYLGFDSRVDDLRVTLNGKSVDAVTNTEGSITEAKISLADADLELYQYDQTASLEITSGAASWIGSVRFDSATMADKTVKGQSNKGSTSGTAIDGGFRIKLDSANTASGQTMNHSVSATSVPELQITDGVGVLEFDFQAVQMSSYPQEAVVKSSHLMVPGLNAVIIYSQEKANLTGYSFGIANIEGKLILAVRRQSGGVVTDPAIMELGKQVGETFRLRMEYAISTKSLTVYCDDVLLGTVENTLHYNSITSGANRAIVYVAVNNASYVSQYGDMTVDFANLRIGSLESGSVLDDLTIADSATESIRLPSFVNVPKLGKVDITWTSSDPSVMGHDGTVKPGSKGTVTLTAAVKQNPSVSRVFTVRVADDTPLFLNAPFGVSALDTAIKLGSLGSIPFGAAYDAENLYLGFDGELDALTVKLNGTAVDAVLTTAGGATTAKIPIGSLNRYAYDQSAPLEISGNGTTWTGTVRFDSATMGAAVEKFTSLASYSGSTLYTDPVTVTASGGVFRFQLSSDIGAAEAGNVPSRRSITAGAMEGVPITSGVSIVEFDMKIDEMPMYSTGSVVKNKYWVVPGFSMTVNCNRSNPVLRYTFGISNLEGYGLAVAVPRNVDGSAADPTILSLGKSLKESFHIRLEYDTSANTLTVYCDNVKLGTVDHLYNVIEPSGQNIHMAAVTYKQADAKLGDVDFTVSSLRAGSLESGSVLDNNLSVEDILGENTTAEAVNADLILPETVTDPMLGQVAVAWKSSDTSIVADDGTVVSGAVGTVKMTASLMMDPTVTKTFELTVSNVKPLLNLDAILNTTGINVDGKLDELTWVKWTRFGKKAGKPSGTLAAAWDREYIYLAMYAANADTMVLTFGETELTVDLTAQTVKVHDTILEGAQIVTANGTTEMKLPKAALGASPQDYNDDTLYFKAVLSGTGGETELAETNFCFSGLTASIKTLTDSKGGWTIANGNHAYSDTQGTTVHYTYKTENSYDETKTIWISQDLHFISMPATTGMATAATNAQGYYYYASRNCDGSNGDMFKICIYADEAGVLRANILKESTLNATIDLGVSVGDAFRLATAWNTDGSIDLYVNGRYVGSSDGNCTFYARSCGNNVLTIRYLSQEVAEPGKVKFECNNLSVVQMTYTSVAGELSVAKVLDRVDLERVTEDLPLVSSYASRYFDNIALTWATSDESVISSTGVVTRGEEDQKCTITLRAMGKELWSVTVTVKSIYETEQPSPAVYTTAYADDVVIDGSITGENWHMANRILSNGILLGEMGAAWNLNYLYVAVRSKEAFALTVNNKPIVLSDVQYAVSGDYTEIAIPMAYIDTEITEYGVRLPVSVTIGDGTYEGTLILSGTDWWGAGNEQDPLPMLSGNVKSVGRGNGVPDGNQGAVEVTDGWHLFDRYSETGTNPDGVRTYILFMKTSPYENFGNRNGTTTVEFDFHALNMPVYKVEEAIVTMTPTAYACYGVNWHLSDAADSMKNSNLVYGGIFNTEDGLCLVTAGKETYTDMLDKKVGDKFRVTIQWHADDSVDVYIDGVLIRHAENQAREQNSIGNASFVVNMLRDLNQPESSADDMDVYMTDIAFGSAFPSDPLATVTWDSIKGENEDMDNITANLVLPTNLYNHQLEVDNVFSWISSDPTVISNDGVVTIPETTPAIVTLTVTLENGASKSFKLLVPSKNTGCGNTLVVEGDTNPAVGVGVTKETSVFVFDSNNNSLIEDMQEIKTINAVRLTDLDAYARINRESLTLWISDDNATYAQIEDYKLLQIGKHWYLYDFTATGRYVKVHYTHFDGTDADFIAPLDGIIVGILDESLVIPDSAQTVTAPATTLRDQTVELPGIADEAFLRIALSGKLLYHYTENGKVFIRIPDPSAVGTVLTVWNAGELELSNKEACLEVTYGTRESYQIVGGGRWLQTVPAGEYKYGTVEKETLLAFGFRTIRASYDGGHTWEAYGEVDQATYSAMANVGISGDVAWIFDEETGAMFCIAHKTNGFSTLEASYGRTVVFASYDMGITWKHAFEIQPDTVEGIPFNYMITYSGGIRVPSYDGAEGEGIDYVFPVACQYTNSGAMCTRVAYTTDEGKTWQMSKSLIIDEGSQSGESGLSEAWILANEEGTLVLFSRAQVVGEVSFAQAYSYDNGLTWTTCETREEWEKETPESNKVQFKVSSVYTSNTQPLMFHYKQTNGIGAPVFVWGGNNTLGSLSYVRTPLSVAVSYDGLETWRNIQNLFAETCMDVYTMEGKSMIVNQSVAQIDGDKLVITFDRNNRKDMLWVTATDFENFLYRTKGAYDAFESGNPFYEGWSSIGPVASNISGEALGRTGQVMQIPRNGIVARSIPYLQNGTITMDVYVDADTNVTYGLQPAVGDNRNAYTLALVQIAGMKLNDTVELKEGWNSIQIRLMLTEGKATVSANGGSEVELTLDQTVGDYVCYVTAFADAAAYMDEFCVVSELDAEIYTGETQKPVELPKISGNLSLNETIDINFIIPASVDMTDAVLEVKNAATGEDVEYTILPGIGGTTVVRYRARANHMTDEITVQVFDAEGNPLTQMASMSVRMYAGIRFAVAEETEKMMLIRMLDYGALAQINSGVTTDLANSIVTDDLRAFADAYDWADAVALEVPAGSGGVFKAGLALNETIDVTVYTAATNVAEGDKFVVKCNGEELTEDQYIVRLLDDGRYVIRYSVKSNEMSDEIYIAIVGEDNTVKAETTLGVRIYAQKFLAAVSTGNQAAMLLAMLDYGAMAQIYADTNTDDLANCFVSDTLRQVLISYSWPAN